MERLTSGSLLDAVRGVHWPARRQTPGAAHGAHRSRRVGASPEFREYRPYQQGDDPARIDWKLFARTERVAIRLAHDDSSLRTAVLVDASQSMAFPVASRGKWELAAAIALGLCAVSHGDNDPVGLAIAHQRGVTALPPRTRRGTVPHMLRLLLETTPGGMAPLAPALQTLRLCRRIAIVSDFLGDADAVLRESRQLIAEGREVFAVHVVAREELEPEATGGIVIDPEDPLRKGTLDSAGLAAYKDAFARWREQLAAAWRGAGAAYRLATTDDLPEDVVRRVAAPDVVARAG
jgi:uncharacterized protein (DUF58 family)